MKVASAQNKISIIDKVGYGMGNFSYGIVSQTMSTYIVLFATGILGIKGGIVGTIVAISVLWDAVTDPLMGHISDSTRSNLFGRRHFYILVGCIFMALLNFMLWNIDPNILGSMKIVLVLSFLLIGKTFQTVYTTPYTALGAELSNDYNERTTIQAIRNMFFLFGIACATVMGMLLFFNPTEEFPIGQLNPMAYKNMGLTVSLASFFLGMISFMSTIKYIPMLKKRLSTRRQKHTLKQIFSRFQLVFHNKYFRYIIIAYLFTNISSALFSTLGLHVYTFTFQLTNKEISLVIGLQFAICILSQPIWAKISALLDKKPSLYIGLGISILGCVAFAVLVFMKDYVAGTIWYFLPISAITGFGIGGLFPIPLSMIADTIDLDELENGIRSEGTYYGLLTLSYKVSQAVTILLIGFLLDILQFNPNQVTQPDLTLIVLGLTIAVGSIIGFMIALLSYKNYDLDATQVKHIQKQIEEKRSRENLLF